MPGAVSVTAGVSRDHGRTVLRDSLVIDSTESCAVSGVC
jgi:hypothetical protein